MNIQTRLLMISLASFSLVAIAEPQCSSVWAYKPWKECVAKPNLNASGSDPQTIDMPDYGRDGGGAGHGEAMCQTAANDFNAKNQSNGLHVVEAQFLSSNAHRSGTFNEKVEYGYNCKLFIKRFPITYLPDRSCGTKETWSYDNSHSLSEIPGDVTCLSCDTFAQGGSASTLAACLKKNITEIVEPKAVDLRQDDLKAMLTNVNKVLNIQQLRPFLSPDDEIFFASWSKKTAAEVGETK